MIASMQRFYVKICYYWLLLSKIVFLSKSKRIKTNKRSIGAPSVEGHIDLHMKMDPIFLQKNDMGAPCLGWDGIRYTLGTHNWGGMGWEILWVPIIRPA